MRREAKPVCDQLPGELFGRGLIGAVSRGDVVARPRERRGDGGTDTPGTAGDYGDAVVNAIHGRLLS